MSPNFSLRLPVLGVLAASAVLLALAVPPRSSADAARAAAKPAATTGPAWRKVDVDLPASDAGFPTAPDADLANAHCLICHSAEMVLHQPALTKDQWRAEVVKMRAAFGAVIPDDRVEALADYLTRINGH